MNYFTLASVISFFIFGTLLLLRTAGTFADTATESKGLGKDETFLMAGLVAAFWPLLAFGILFFAMIVGNSEAPLHYIKMIDDWSRAPRGYGEALGFWIALGTVIMYLPTIPALKRQKNGPTVLN